MNRMNDTAILPDLARTVYLVKKDKNGHNDWWILPADSCDSFLPEEWFKALCDKHSFFAWSYYPYGADNR